MLKRILNMEGTQALNRQQMKTIRGSFVWPVTEEDCLACGGTWHPELDYYNRKACFGPLNSSCFPWGV